MFNKTTPSIIVLAGLAIQAVIPPPALAAWPFGRMLHLHPSEVRTEDQRITVELFNRGGLVQQVRIGDRTYTLMPHQALSITAPEGNQVYALDQGFGHRKGQLLFTVARNMQPRVTLD